MFNWHMYDLRSVFITLRADPACICAEALAAMAHLCSPGTDGCRDAFRRVLRAWPVQSAALPHISQWIRTDNEYPSGPARCGTEEECAMLRAILHTAARLRREEKLRELSALADAAHNFPEMIARRDPQAMQYISSELQYVRQNCGVTLLPPPPADRESTLSMLDSCTDVCTSGE